MPTKKLQRKPRAELAKKVETVAAINTVLQTLILRWMGSDTPFQDFVLMGTGNYLLYESVKNHSDKMSDDVKNAYFPLTSSLYFSMYSNVAHGNSYINTIATSIPVAIIETALI